MKASLQTLCDQFIENRDTVKSAFKWDNSYVYPLCANIFCAHGQMAEAEKLTRCRKIIQEQTGIFSNFRGNLRPALAALLALGQDPEAKMAQAVENYDILKRDFWGSEYLALIAFLLTDFASRADVEEKAGRGKEIYQRMKKEHPFLTSSEDSVFAVMMAFSEKNNDALINDMEGCYQALRARFTIGNALQSVSHVLALSNGAPEEKAGRVIDLYNALRGADVRYGRDYELATLAALAEMDENIPGVAEEVTEVYEYLSTQRGYGFFGPGKAARAMHAAMIVSDQYSSRGQIDTAAMTGTLAMIIAQEMAMCAVMVSASASSAAASSSSH